MAIWVKVSELQGGLYAARPMPEPLLVLSMDEVDAQIAAAEAALSGVEQSLTSKTWYDVAASSDDLLTRLSESAADRGRLIEELRQLRAYQAGILSGAEV